MPDLAHLLQQQQIEARSWRLLFKLDTDEVFGFTVDGDAAFDTWLKLRDLVPQTGHWPVIVGRSDDEDLPTRRVLLDQV